VIGFSLRYYFIVLALRGWPLSEKSKLAPIGTAAKKAGISRQSLQYYLMVGLLEPTEVTPSGRRLFDEKCIERIKLIKNLNKSGYPLRAIRELFMEGRGDFKGGN
jgi:DNA-binding transcriptional MerR regulator